MFCRRLHSDGTDEKMMWGYPKIKEIKIVEHVKIGNFKQEFNLYISRF